MVPLTDDAVAAGASTKTVEDILDANLWPGFDKFRVVQGILDRNKVLIHEINRAHHTYPWDVRRAAERIRELNANLGKVQELYEEATGGFNAAALSNRRDIRASE